MLVPAPSGKHRDAPATLKGDGGRVKKSCDRCVTLKKRCCGTTPSCKRCLVRSFPCTYSQEKQRGRPKGVRNRTKKDPRTLRKVASDSQLKETASKSMGAASGVRSGAAGSVDGGSDRRNDSSDDSEDGVSSTNSIDDLGSILLEPEPPRQQSLSYRTPRPPSPLPPLPPAAAGQQARLFTTTPPPPPQQHFPTQQQQDPMQVRGYLVSYKRCFAGFLPDAPGRAAASFLDCHGRLPLPPPAETDRRTARVAAVEGLACVAIALGCLVQGASDGDHIGLMLLTNVHLQHALSCEEALDVPDAVPSSHPPEMNAECSLEAARSLACAMPLPTATLVAILGVCEAICYRLTGAKTFFNDCVGGLVGFVRSAEAVARGSGARRRLDAWLPLLPTIEQLHWTKALQNGVFLPLTRVLPTDEAAEAAALRTGVPTQHAAAQRAPVSASQTARRMAPRRSASYSQHSQQQQQRPAAAAAAAAATSFGSGSGAEPGKRLRSNEVQTAGAIGKPKGSERLVTASSSGAAQATTMPPGLRMLRCANFVMANVQLATAAQGDLVRPFAERCRWLAIDEAQSERLAAGLLPCLVCVCAYLTYVATQPLTVAIAESAGECLPVLQRVLQFCPGVLAWVPGAHIAISALSAAKAPGLGAQLSSAWAACQRRSSDPLPPVRLGHIARALLDGNAKTDAFTQWLAQECNRWSRFSGRPLAPTLLLHLAVPHAAQSEGTQTAFTAAPPQQQPLVPARPPLQGPWLPPGRPPTPPLLLPVLEMQSQQQQQQQQEQETVPMIAPQIVFEASPSISGSHTWPHPGWEGPLAEPDAFWGNRTAAEEGVAAAAAAAAGIGAAAGAQVPVNDYYHALGIHEPSAAAGSTSTSSTAGVQAGGVVSGGSVQVSAAAGPWEQQQQGWAVRRSSSYNGPPTRPQVDFDLESQVVSGFDFIDEMDYELADSS